MPTRLASEILSKIWLIEENSAQAYIPFILGLTDGKGTQIVSEEDLSAKREAQRPYALLIAGPGMVGAISARAKFNEAPKGSIAVINLSGPLMKQDQWCGPEGTATIAQYIQQADSNVNIDAIILKIYSPGGTVDGTEALANIIKKTSKPIIAYVDGMAASAAMWIASACDEIIASSNTDIIGSIGTMISFMDMKPAFEKAGFKFHEVMADASFLKNEEFREALKGNYKPLKENLLNPTNNVFVAAIKSNRKGKVDPDQEELFNGKIYLPKQALKIGLIDSIGDFEFAVNRASELSKVSSQNNTQTNMKINIQSAWNGLKSLLGLKAEADQDIQHELTAEELQKMNARIDQANELEAEVGRLKTDLETANSSITSITQERDSLKTEFEEFKKNPTKATVVVAEGEKIETTEKREPYSWEKKAANLSEY